MRKITLRNKFVSVLTVLAMLVPMLSVNFPLISFAIDDAGPDLVESFTLKFRTDGDDPENPDAGVLIDGSRDADVANDTLRMNFKFDIIGAIMSGEYVDDGTEYNLVIPEYVAIAESGFETLIVEFDDGSGTDRKSTRLNSSH